MLTISAWGYLLGAIILLSVFYGFANDSWLAMVLLYAPRWPWTIPGILLAAAALFRRRVLLAPLGVALVLVAWPVMGLCVPWRLFRNSATVGPSICVLICNCGTDGLHVSVLKDTIENVDPDIIALQEAPSAILPEIAKGNGWHVHSEDNLILLSRFPISEARAFRSSSSDWPVVRAIQYVLDCNGQAISLVNVHLDTPREGMQALLVNPFNAARLIEQNTARRREELTSIAAWINAPSAPQLVVGDFNMPVESSLYREAFGRYQNAFSHAGWGWGATKYTRWHGVRIDHILANSDWQINKCWVAPDVGSDHRPLVAEMSLKRPGTASSAGVSPVMALPTGRPAHQVPSGIRGSQRAAARPPAGRDCPAYHRLVKLVHDEGVGLPLISGIATWVAAL